MATDEALGKKKGSWHGGDPRDFAEYLRAIHDVLDDQDPGSVWIVDMEMKGGNPVHDYRIVLSPSVP
jgi:hypothetical protein